MKNTDVKVDGKLQVTKNLTIFSNADSLTIESRGEVRVSNSAKVSLLTSNASANTLFIKKVGRTPA
jgi:hypothetical protein